MTRESLVNRGGLLAVLIVTCLSVAAFAAPSEDVIYSFQKPGVFDPDGNLVADSAGNLYGTASPYYGGVTPPNEVVFELLRPVPPNTQWTLNVLCSLNEGFGFASGVIFDDAGNLYGVTEFGGGGAGCAYGCGVVFELTPPATGGGQWKETVLHNFQGGPTDGALPQGLVFDGSGDLYGVTYLGGINCRKLGCGVVFKLTPPATKGGEWTETVIHFFDGAGGGWFPQAAPILDGKGNLYGTTYAGGKYDHGLVYILGPPATAGGAWNYARLHSFAGYPADGEKPDGSLSHRGDGNLYGVTFEGGQNDVGTAFELAPPTVLGGEWTENILHSFGASPSDGDYPVYNVIFDGAGNLYGTTAQGGADENRGTVYELSPPATEGGNWTETILHSFLAYPSDAGYPGSGLLPSKEGALFGVSGSGGAEGYGAVYRVIP